MEISQKFVAFSENINFNKELIKVNSRKLTCNSGHIKRVDTSILVLSAGLGESRPNWGRLYNHKDPLSSPQQINPLPKIQKKTLKHLDFTSYNHKTEWSVKKLNCFDYSICKGQLKLKCPLCVFKSSKKTTKNFPGFLH